MSEDELQLIKEQTKGILHLMNYIKFWRYIEMLQKDSETLNKRLRKWEKWTTEKAILSSKMGEYLCKWQNVKREYTKQNKILTFKNQEIERLKEELKYTIPIVEHNKTITKHLKEIERLNNDIERLNNNINELEKIIDSLLNFIKQQFNEEVINGTFNMSSDELIDYIKSTFI